jgi:hypothetical protein
MHLETTTALELDSTELEDATLELDTTELEDATLELDSTELEDAGSEEQAVSTHHHLSEALLLIYCGTPSLTRAGFMV